MLSFYLSLFGAPNLEPIDSPANATGPAPSGLSTANLRANWGPSFAPGYEFTDCLAIFFPCFTGILSGANRASSLRDPASAIPRGTLGAITLSFCVYVSFLILWAAVGEREYLTMEHGQLDELIYPSVKAAQIGIVLSSLGQALQCVVVAPRLLASIAADGMLRPMRSLARLTGGEPKLALGATYLVGAMCVLIGSLNAVAPLLSMCFLTCYSMMNLNCCLLGLLKDPHWRPRFRYFHWAVGLVGFVLCTSIMFVIDWRYALGAWLLTLLVLALVVRTNAQTDWGSALVGLRFQLAMRSLTGIDIKAHLDENWRPQLLLLYHLREEESHGSRRGSSAAAGWGEAEPPAEPSSSSLGDLVRGDVGHTHERMFSVAAQLRHGSGLVIAAAVVPGASADSLRAVALAEAERARMDSLMGRMGVRGFCKTILARTLLEGKLGAIQWAGLGPLVPNTLLMGWPWWWRDEPEKYVPELVSTINAATIHEKTLLLCHRLSSFPGADEELSGFIDVWWIIRDGGLMLLMAHLMRKHRVWRGCDLRLHLVMEAGVDPRAVRSNLHELLRRINIEAEVEEVLLVARGSILPYMRTSAQRSFEEEKRAAAEQANPHLHSRDEDVRQLSSASPAPDARLAPVSRRSSTAGHSAASPHSAASASLAPPHSGRRTSSSRAASRAPSQTASCAPSQTASCVASRATTPPPVEARSSPPPSPPAACEAESSSENSSEDGEGTPLSVLGGLRLPPDRRGVELEAISVLARAPAAVMVEPGPAEPGPAAQKSSWSLAASRPARWIRESRSLPSLPTAAAPPPPVDSPKRRLADFAARHGLGDEAVAELADLFSSSQHGRTDSSVAYDWDEIHALIVERSVGSSLVILNLPDAPDNLAPDRSGGFGFSPPGSPLRRSAGRPADVSPPPGADASGGLWSVAEQPGEKGERQRLAAHIEYVEYIEGLAQNLPRVLFVHGAGREVIRFAE